MSIILCRVDEIAEGTARSFVIGGGTARRDIVVARKDGHIFAYENSCPHEGTPLETFPDKFLNQDGSLFVCSTHGARFRIEDGFCVSGPCEGKALMSVAVLIEHGRLSVE